MAISNISLNRSIGSYYTVQGVVSKFIRGNPLFIRRSRIRDLPILNVGCGDKSHPGCVNIDYRWTPGIDVCWDITKKAYPFPDERFEGIYTEHCLEHIPYDSCRRNLVEFRRILKPGGILRVVIPDGELYLDLYARKKTDKSVMMPYGENEATAMISVNRIFRAHRHLFIYDFETFGMLLEEAGFRNITRVKFMQGSDSRLLMDSAEREIESLYIEAQR